MRREEYIEKIKEYRKKLAFNQSILPEIRVAGLGLLNYDDLRKCYSWIKRIFSSRQYIEFKKIYDQHSNWKKYEETLNTDLPEYVTFRTARAAFHSYLHSTMPRELWSLKRRNK